jgi:hypothetical protein
MRTESALMRSAHPRAAHTDRHGARLAQLLEAWIQAQATPEGQAASVLGGAIGKLAFSSQRSRKFREARAWCWNDDRRRPLAFLTQCDRLGIAPGILRRHLRDFLRERETRAAGVHPRGAGQTNLSSQRGGKRVRQENRDVA